MPTDTQAAVAEPYADPALDEALQMMREARAQRIDLRDWIAASALTTIMQADGIQYMSGASIKRHAETAYEYADAMLAARRKAEAAQ